MAELTEEVLRQIMPNLPSSKRHLYLPHLNAAMLEFSITTELRAAAFLAQLAHESEELKYMEEIASGSAYEGRKDLGNVHQGDGRRFKGRGPIQLTGRFNYRKFGKLLGVDLENNPELASTPEIAFKIAGQFWDINGLNELSDKRQFKAITKRINGGYNGLADRIKYYDRALRVIPSDFNLDGADRPVDEEHPDYEKEDETQSENKGITTSPDSKQGETEGVPPPMPAVEVEPSKPSLMSRITALSMPVGAGGVIMGIKTFIIGIPPWGWAIIGGCFVIMVIIGAWLYNEAMKRAAGRTAQVISAAADKNKNNIRII